MRIQVLVHSASSSKSPSTILNTLRHPVIDGLTFSKKRLYVLEGQEMHKSCVYLFRASDRGRIGVFYAYKMPKTHWDDIGDLKYVFTKM
jgi:hypothetical protein